MIPTWHTRFKHKLQVLQTIITFIKSFKGLGERSLLFASLSSFRPETRNTFNRLYCAKLKSLSGYILEMQSQEFHQRKKARDHYENK